MFSFGSEVGLRWSKSQLTVPMLVQLNAFMTRQGLRTRGCKANLLKSMRNERMPMKAVSHHPYKSKSPPSLSINRSKQPAYDSNSNSYYPSLEYLKSTSIESLE
jgi:hypothetical protein